VQLASVAVAPDEIEALLTFAPNEPMRTSEVPDLAKAVVRALPGLRGHRCDNDGHATFPDELRDTEIAHLVEHAALEIMAMAGSPDTLRGRTSWDFARDGRGVFRVCLEYDRSPVASGALQLAVELVSALAGEATPPDVLAAVSTLREARRSG